MNIPFHKPMTPKSFDKIYPKSIADGWLTTGPEVNSFEHLLSDFTESNYTVAVNSCTAALHLALAAMGFSKGDQFIVPTYTFAASVEVGEYLGMQPMLVDCDDNYNINLNHVEDLLLKNDKIKAIIPVHFAGKPVDMANLHSIVGKKDIFILEDAAHALEAISNLSKVGNTNHATAFSFYANKNITTGGEGGAITTNNQKLADKIRKLSLHGMSKDGWNRFKTGSKWQYDVSDLGYKYNLTDMSAVFGKWQFSYLNEWYKKRVWIFNEYQKYFKNINGIVCPSQANKNEKHAHHLYIIRLLPEFWKINRDSVIRLLNEAGIGTSVHYMPIHMHSYYQKKYRFKPDDFPKSKDYFENVITLPLYPLLKKKEINFIIDFINDLWKKYRLI
jgi:dTDP-4-amino-4,6-dideoxygalactose transaminase